MDPPHDTSAPTKAVCGASEPFRCMSVKTYLRKGCKQQEKEQQCQSKRREETSLKEDREKNMTEQRLQLKQLAEQGLEPENPPEQTLRGGALKGLQELQDPDPNRCAALASPKGQNAVCGESTGEQKSVCAGSCLEESGGVFHKILFVIIFLQYQNQ